MNLDELPRKAGGEIKSRLISIVFLLITLVQQACESRKPAALVFDKTAIECGPIETNGRTSIQRLVFEARNDSVNDVKIRRAVPSCYCVTVKAPESIPARGTALFEVGFSIYPTDFRGRTAAILVETDEKAVGPYMLQLSGRAQFDIAIEPSEINMGDIWNGESREAAVLVLIDGAATEESVKILDAPLISVGAKRARLTKHAVYGRMTEITVPIFVKAAEEPGRKESNMILQVNKDNERRVSVPIGWTVKPELCFNQDAVIFRTEEDQKTINFSSAKLPSDIEFSFERQLFFVDKTNLKEKSSSLVIRKNPNRHSTEQRDKLVAKKNGITVASVEVSEL